MRCGKNKVYFDRFLVLHSTEIPIVFVHIQVINKGGITYKSTPWHRECFTCNGCNKVLVGEKFTSRDEKPYCSECFANFFAKKCIRCTQPITGELMASLRESDYLVIFLLLVFDGGKIIDASTSRTNYTHSG
jgi:hypothetical protein